MLVRRNTTLDFRQSPSWTEDGAQSERKEGLSGRSSALTLFRDRLELLNQLAVEKLTKGRADNIRTGRHHEEERFLAP